MKAFHLHLISDSTGDTLNSVSRACLAQFNGVQPIEHFSNMVRSEKQLNAAMENIDQYEGLVLYTIVDEHLRNRLKNFCRKRKIPCLPVLEPVLKGFSSFLGMPSLSLPGRQHTLDGAYFDRMDAMDFVLRHDDGQHIEELHDADVVLIGVSRTSKTPTCVYLGNRGIKAANIPFVKDVTNLDEIRAIKGPLFIGLTESPKRLIDIRRNRLNGLNEKNETHYTILESVEEEVRLSRRFYSEMKWPVIDVTNRSVEETAAEIIKLLKKQSTLTSASPSEDA